MSKNKVCILALDPSWQPFDWYTKKDAIRLLMKGAVRGIDANMVDAGWFPNENRGHNLSWSDQTVTPHDDAPTLTSGSFEGYREWKLPTVVIIRPQDGMIDNHREKISPNSLQGIYKLYDGKCSFCGRTIRMDEASRDHYFPQKEGGANALFNIVLACKPCNNKKGHQFPYYDKDGNEPRIRVPLRGGIRLPFGLKMREEWKQFMYR